MDVSLRTYRYFGYLKYLLMWAIFVVFMLEYAGLIDLVRGFPGWR